MELKIWKKLFEIILNDTDLAQKILKASPLKQELDWRYWDEIYSLTSFWFELDETAKEIMEIWDIAYWVKNDWSKEALVVFFWNTPAWNWTKPRPVSKCSVIWRILSEIEWHESLVKWDKIILW